MTIAAGFLCPEGVLLCADTEISGWTLKHHESKLRYFDCPGGRIGFAIAGNIEFAHATIDKCARRMAMVEPEKTIPCLEKFLDREYRRTVLSNEVARADERYHYQLLIAVWLRNENKARLYVTLHTTIRPVGGFECIGLGRELAGYLIRPVTTGLSMRRAIALAAYALKAAKDSVQNCGGMTVYLQMMNDGRVGTITSIHRGITEYIERFSNEFDFLCRNLLFRIAELDAPDESVECYMREFFAAGVMQARREWSREYEDRLQAFRAMNPYLNANEPQARAMFSDITRDLIPLSLVGGQHPQPPKGDPSEPLPLPGSREGTDES